MKWISFEIEIFNQYLLSVHERAFFVQPLALALFVDNQALNRVQTLEFVLLSGEKSLHLVLVIVAAEAQSDYVAADPIHELIFLTNPSTTP